MTEWRTCWELDLTPADHAQLATLVARCFPGMAARVAGGRSWAAQRPELRVIGYADGVPVAHLGVLRRVVRVGGVDVLVGDVGLVGTDPDRRGQGLGRALLDRARARLLELGLPFGWLTCGPGVVGFYRAAGWQQLAGRVTRMIDREGAPRLFPDPAMLLPLHAPAADWPAGDIDCNGFEV